MTSHWILLPSFSVQIWQKLCLFWKFCSNYPSSDVEIMADFFKTALGFISNVGTRDENDFVGQYVELGDQKLRVKRQIAEGTYFHWTISSIPEYCFSKENAIKKINGIVKLYGARYMCGKGNCERKVTVVRVEHTTAKYWVWMLGIKPKWVGVCIVWAVLNFNFEPSSLYQWWFSTKLSKLSILSGHYIESM